LTTKPLRWQGKRLVLNVRTAAEGNVRVAILNADGTPRPGLDGASCDAIRGDQVRGAVSWNGRSDLSALKGQAVRVKLDLARASLYSMRISMD
jgi:hypothetical protein